MATIRHASFMKIAQVVAAREGSEPGPRDVERVVGYLTAQFVADGHEATLFTCGSTASSRSRRFARRSLAVPPAAEALQSLFTHASRFDLIHLHGDLQQCVRLSNVSTPIVATLHGYPNPGTLSARSMFPDIALVAVSEHQRNLFQGLRWRGIVPSGLPERLHSFHVDPGNYLAYAGSLTCVNSLRRAVEIAMRSRLPLKIADYIVGRELRRIEQELAPLVAAGASVEFVGRLDCAGLSELLGGARALLFTNEWSEPCPLAVLDALACGTPVIAWRASAIEELIEPGRSGFTVGSVDEAVDAVEHVEVISRLSCRRTFDERFGAQRMARDYAALYAQLLSTSTQIARYAALGGRASIDQGGAL